MATKTISLAEDAYERLEAEKRAGESFSDVVRRLTAGPELAAYYGALSDETGSALADVVEDRRRERTEAHERRIRRLSEALE